MGDLMHALPALTDAVSVWPDITFDWVVDESFAEVPSWHPAVSKIFKSAHRRWRREFIQSVRQGDFTEFYKAINADPYDVVIDAQNNIKSSFISLLRKGPVHGMDRDSVAEKPAFLAYRTRHKVNKRFHAITRQRALFAHALEYPLPETEPDYGLKTGIFTKPALEISEPYIVLVHNASWTNKLWLQEYWHELIGLADAAGVSVVLPGGSQEELYRADEIAVEHDNAIALPRMSLTDLGGIIQHARGAICCDTGLAHLTAMIGTPAVTMYGPTSADLIGTTGKFQQHLVAQDPPFSCAPCYKRKCTYEGGKTAMGACMAAFTPKTAWKNLLLQIKAKNAAR